MADTEFGGYTGVYSDKGIGTSIGTTVTGTDDGNVVIEDHSTKRQLTVSTQALKDAKLNVAKLRLVSTVPNKEVDKDVAGKAFIGFILSSVQESHSEKLEIVPLPGDSYASYFYGGNPRQFTFSGTLLNTDQDKWRDSFELMYEKYLRGSASSRNFNIVQVSYDTRVVSGWLTSLSQQLDGSNDRFSMFSFTLLVSRIDMLGGNKQFKDYLLDVQDNGPFSGVNLQSDYAVLDPSNLNAMIDPIRTGMVIPPKRPHRAPGKRKKQVNCWFEAPTTDAGKPTNPGSQVGNSHINDSYTCTIIEQVVGTTEKIKELTDSANKLSEKGDFGKAYELRLKADTLADSLSTALTGGEDNPALIQLKEEAEGIYNRAQANKGRLTAEQRRSLERGIISVKGANIGLKQDGSVGLSFDTEYVGFKRNSDGSVVASVGPAATQAISESRTKYIEAEKRIAKEKADRQKAQEELQSTNGQDRLLGLTSQPRRRR